MNKGDKSWGFVPRAAPFTMPKPAPAPRVELEDRVCRCGCGRKFRALPTSKQLFASRSCEAAGC